MVYFAIIILKKNTLVIITYIYINNLYFNIYIFKFNTFISYIKTNTIKNINDIIKDHEIYNKKNKIK